MYPSFVTRITEGGEWWWGNQGNQENHGSDRGVENYGLGRRDWLFVIDYWGG